MYNKKVIVIRGGDLRKEGIKTFVGVMTAAQLIGLYEVPVRHVMKKQGYQRQASDTRVRSLASDLHKKAVDLPTAVLLSVRKPYPEGFVEQLSEANETFKMNLSLLGDNGKKLYVVDGQHRIRALEFAIDEHADKLQNYKVPFVCMLGADENLEMEQFYVVNKNAKSVSTDLAYDLLAERSKGDPSLMKELISKGKKWEIDANEISKNLMKNKGIWQHKIRLANMQKEQTTIPGASFIKSLKSPLTNSGIFGQLSLDKQCQLINEYWRGIEKNLPEAFIEEEQYGFSLQKGIGVSGLHALLPFVIEQVRNNGDSVYDADAYAKVLSSPLLDIQISHGEQGMIQGLDFWRSGRAGGVGSFTSGAGQKTLFEMLKALLPPLEVE